MQLFLSTVFAICIVIYFLQIVYIAMDMLMSDSSEISSKARLRFWLMPVIPVYITLKNKINKLPETDKRDEL